MSSFWPDLDLSPLPRPRAPRRPSTAIRLDGQGHDLEAVAVHEAAHVVWAWRRGVEVESASIIDKWASVGLPGLGGLAGEVLWSPVETTPADAMVEALLAGPVAEKRHRGARWSAARWFNVWSFVRAWHLDVKGARGLSKMIAGWLDRVRDPRGAVPWGRIMREAADATRDGGPDCGDFLRAARRLEPFDPPPPGVDLTDAILEHAARRINAAFRDEPALWRAVELVAQDLARAGHLDTATLAAHPARALALPSGGP